VNKKRVPRETVFNYTQNKILLHLPSPSNFIVVVRCVLCLSWLLGVFFSSLVIHFQTEGCFFLVNNIKGLQFLHPPKAKMYLSGHLQSRLFSLFKVCLYHLLMRKNWMEKYFIYMIAFLQQLYKMSLKIVLNV
jgi:hypothetical protein